jgi:hypothetical protein
MSLNWTGHFPSIPVFSKRVTKLPDMSERKLLIIFGWADLQSQYLQLFRDNAFDAMCNTIGISCNEHHTTIQITGIRHRILKRSPSVMEYLNFSVILKFVNVFGLESQSTCVLSRDILLNSSMFDLPKGYTSLFIYVPIFRRTIILYSSMSHLPKRQSPYCISIGSHSIQASHNW